MSLECTDDNFHDPRHVLAFDDEMTRAHDLTPTGLNANKEGTTMTLDKTTVRIEDLTGSPTVLYEHYEGQMQPQGAFIALDLRDGRMWAGVNHEIGNAVPSDVWHGIVRRYPIPALQPATVNELMRTLAPYAQRVLDGSEIVWDGSNHVARMNDDALAADDDIYGGEYAILPEEAESDVYVWDARDWLVEVVPDIRDRFREGATVDTMYEEYQGDGASEDHPYVEGLRAYLEDLREEALAQPAEGE